VQIDLTGVTYLDDSGKKLLAALHAQGAEFVAAGCLMKAIVAEITGKPECINPVSNFKERALYREKLSGRVRAIQRSFMYANSGTSTDHETLLDNFTAQLTEAAYLVALRHDGDDSWIDLKLDLWEVLADAIHKHRRELSRGSAGSKTVDARAEVSRCNEYGSVIT
jgi:hypothetical protein